MISNVAASAHAPFVAGASAKMFNFDSYTELSKPRDLAKIFEGVEYASWWNPLTARYFPQRQRLPALDFMGLANLRNADQAALDQRLAQLASGAAGGWPALSPGLGWAQPWGTPDGGMVSGEEIDLYDGITTACAASTAGCWRRGPTSTGARSRPSAR